MRVVMIGDVAHVVINGPGRFSELDRRDEAERVMEMALDLGRGRGVVHAPDNHGHEAYLAVTNPTGVVFEVTLSDDGCYTKFAAIAHFTVRVTDDFHGTIVPAVGLSDTTVVHLVVLAFGPVVVKYNVAFFIAA